jgi:signal peptidase II
VLFSLYAVVQHLNGIPIYFESFVVGGAISNIIDRVHYGVVIDFIDLHLGIWHWATFNIADVFIMVGVLGVLFKSIKRKTC